MNSNTILIKNEEEANRLASRFMLATISFLVLVFALNIAKIFLVPLDTMSIALVPSAILLFIPTLLVSVLKLYKPWVKYVSVLCAVLMVFLVSTFLSYHAVLLYLYPLAIASLFFSRKLSWITTIINLVLVSVSQILSLYSGGVDDKNFTNISDIIMFGILPRMIILLAISILFILLSKRTYGMLANMMGAEEQAQMLKHMQDVSNKSFEVCNTLTQSSEQLTDITRATTIANEQITENTSHVVAGSQQTLDNINLAASSIMEISDNLNHIASESLSMEKTSENTQIITQQNMQNMEKVITEMNAIVDSAKESKAIISLLEEKTNIIGQIVEVITNISSQTNLLALNASIESARAGEQGKGFAVVASEIRGLAEQSQKAAKEIKELVTGIVENTSKAVKVIDNSNNMIDHGVEAIRMTEESFEDLTKANSEINKIVHSVNSVTQKMAKNSDQLVSIIENIRSISSKTQFELQSIASASEEQLAAMEEVNASVETIEKTANELMQVIKTE